MSDVPTLNNERYFKFAIFILLFLLLVFDRDMSMIYILVMFGDYVWYRFDRKISFNLEKTSKNRMSSLVEVAIATTIFFAVSTAAVSLSAVDIPATPQSVLSLLATATPVLAGNKILTFVGWALLIPIIETSFFFGRLFEGMATFFETRFQSAIPLTPSNLGNKLVILVIFVVAAFFTLFHLTAKNLASVPLLITFIFAVISCILVVRNQELKQAVMMHILVNGLAVLSSFGALPF